VSGWRHQAPVHSPLSLAALLAGARAAAARNGAASKAEAQVTALLRERYTAKAVLLTDSGTAALTAALLAILKGRPGSPVALPAYACYDLATAADGANAPVLLYDLDPRTLAPDLAQVEAAMRQGATAIVVAHFYGCPVDLGEVNRLATIYGTVVIEDAAQALGATVRDRPAGSQSSLAVLSFGRGKGLTGGSGGALLAHDAAGQRILDRAKELLVEARRGWPELLMTTAQFFLERPNVYALPAALPFLHLGETIYRTPRPLRGPASASCPVVAATWQLAEREADVRRRNAERLLLELQAQPGFEIITSPSHARPGYLRLPVLASPDVFRSVAEPATRRLGVMAGYPKVLCDLERFGSRCLNRNHAFPGSRLLTARLCTVPTHGRLRARDLAGLERWIRAPGTV
jgi:dTDP-4-amino-4,6-dideoxygalactose transaminase